MQAEYVSFLFMPAERVCCGRKDNASEVNEILPMSDREGDEAGRDCFTPSSIAASPGKTKQRN